MEKNDAVEGKKFSLKAYIAENKKSLIKKAAILVGAAVGIIAIGMLVSHEPEPVDLVDYGSDDVAPVALPVETVAETPQE